MEKSYNRSMSDFSQGLRSPQPQRHGARWAWLLLVIPFLYLIYSGAAWAWFRPVLHKQLINKYSGEYKFDPLWVMAIIKVESGFFSQARSHKGAVGLMQLLPSTAQELGPEIGLSNIKEEDLKNPDTNLHLGVYYLAKIQQMFPGDEIAVLAAYNAGPGVTREWLKGKPALDVSDIAYPETRRFVRHVDRTYGFLKMMQGWKYLLGIAHGH
jgi:soluble lytic murein transglycosylase